MRTRMHTHGLRDEPIINIGSSLNQLRPWAAGEQNCRCLVIKSILFAVDVEMIVYWENPTKGNLQSSRAGSFQKPPSRVAHFATADLRSISVMVNRTLLSRLPSL